MAKHDKKDIGVSTILNPVPVVMVSCAGVNADNEAERPNIMTVCLGRHSQFRAAHALCQHTQVASFT